MANWDHLSNIGLHPAHDPDPAVSLPVRLEAAAFHAAQFQAQVDALSAEMLRAGLNIFDVRGAISRGRQRSNEYVA
jgi:hypothetical protein